MEIKELGAEVHENIRRLINLLLTRRYWRAAVVDSVAIVRIARYGGGSNAA